MGYPRTEFRCGSTQIAEAMPEYQGNPAQAYERMLTHPPDWHLATRMHCQSHYRLR